MNIFPKYYTSKDLPLTYSFSTPSASLPLIFFPGTDQKSVVSLNDLLLLGARDILLHHGYFRNTSYYCPLQSFALTPTFTSHTRTFFRHLVDKNILSYSRDLVYRDKETHTPIAPCDIIRQEENTALYLVKYFVSTKNNALDVLVEDPALIFGDVAIALHPQHKKAKHLKGQEVIIPIINKTIPIIIDERADFIHHSGVRRITPGHDAISLAIAKDHNLPLDIYAVDPHGKFTEHAGIFAHKPVDEFVENIIQNLSDINNLIESRSEIKKIPRHIFSNNRLFPRTIVGWFFAGETEYPWCVQGNSSFTIPTWTKDSLPQYFDTDAFLAPKKKHASLFTILLFHLFLDHHLEDSFSLERLIDVLYGSSPTKHTSLLEYYLNAYSSRGESLDIPASLDTIKKVTDSEILAETLEHLLTTSFGIVSQGNKTYSFDFSLFGTGCTKTTLSKETFSPLFLEYLFLLDALGILQEQTPETFLLLTPEHSLKKSKLFLSFFSSLYGQTGTLCEIPALPFAKDTTLAKKELNQYGMDTFMLSFLLTSSPISFSFDLLQENQELLTSFWNCCRYVRTTLCSSHKKTSYKKLLTTLTQQASDFSPFDTWIFTKSQNLIQEFLDNKDISQLFAFGTSCWHTALNDFARKYLELIKTSPSELSSSLALFVSGTFLKLLSPYLPLFTRKLWELMEFSDALEDTFPETDLAGLQRNYLISLFMDIIDALIVDKQKLALKKHTAVSIFIKANPDFLRFAKSHEALFKNTLHADEILYLTHHDTLPKGYQHQDIIDITIGLKEFFGAPRAHNELLSLQKTLEEKETYLQHLKGLVSSMNANGGDPISIAEKKQEIATLKDDIEHLSLTITKMKMKE